MANRLTLKILFCLISFFSIKIVHADKKEDALKLVNTIVELPILKWGNENEYMHGFYLPIREYSETGTISVVELRTPQREIMYRCEMNNATAFPGEILVYTSIKTDTYANVENGAYEVKPYMRIKLTYAAGKIQTILYKDIRWDEDGSFEEMAVEYTPTGMMKRVYHTKPSDYGSVFEAHYVNNHPDSINVGLLETGGKVSSYKTMRVVYDVKGNVTAYKMHYLDGTYFETNIITYTSEGAVEAWYMKKYSPTGSTKHVFGYVFTYENSRITKADYYFDYISELDANPEDVKKADNVKKLLLYTYLPNGNLISYKDVIVTDCVITDRTTTYTLDARGMVLKQTTVDKSKFKCKY